MATNNKLNNLLRNSIAAETKRLDQRDSTEVKAMPTPAIAAQKPAVNKTVPVIKATTTPAKKKPAVAKAKLKTSPSKPVKTAPKANRAAAAKRPTPAKASNNTHTSTTAATNKQYNFATNLTHDKLHQIVETHYHICESYLDNLQKVNQNLHDYFNQLVEINNISSLVKLNLSYLSSAPTRLQEMIAQNKSIYSDFFKFATPKAK